MLTTQKQRYKYLAYIVIRDAIGFYFGIPKFLEQKNLESVLRKAVTEKVMALKNEKGRELTQKEVTQCVRSVRRQLISRIRELESDFDCCQQVLFEDNLWLQLLDVNETFFASYLPKLNDKTKDMLAVVPKLKTRDHSLGRPYINDNFNF